MLTLFLPLQLENRVVSKCVVIPRSSNKPVHLAEQTENCKIHTYYFIAIIKVFVG